MPPPLLFCSNADLLSRFDSRWISMNLLDDGTTATTTQLLDTTSVAGARLQILLGDASEVLMSAASVSARYSVNDLLVYGGNLVTNITAGLAFGIILKRRGRAVTTNKMISDAFTEAMSYIEQLRRGDRIFSMVPLVPQAGLPGTASMQSCPGVPYGDPDITQVSGRYFGQGLNPSCGCGGNPYLGIFGSFPGS